MRTAGLIAGTLVVVTFGGCNGNLFGPDVGLDVETDRTSYAAEEPVVVTLKNTGGVELVFPRCGDQVATTVEARVDGRWEEHVTHGEFCVAIYPMVPLELGPGSEYEYVLGSPGEGEFRLRVHRAGEGSAGGFRSGAFRIGS